jgi:hypothetical protein
MATSFGVPLGSASRPSSIGSRPTVIVRMTGCPAANTITMPGTGGPAGLSSAISSGAVNVALSFGPVTTLRPVTHAGRRRASQPRPDGRIVERRYAPVKKIVLKRRARFGCHRAYGSMP